MLGCDVEYVADGPPLVRAANIQNLELSPEAAFRSPAYRRWERSATRSARNMAGWRAT